MPVDAGFPGSCWRCQTRLVPVKQRANLVSKLCSLLVALERVNRKVPVMHNFLGRPLDWWQILQPGGNFAMAWVVNVDQAVADEFRAQRNKWIVHLDIAASFGGHRMPEAPPTQFPKGVPMQDIQRGEDVFAQPVALHERSRKISQIERKSHAPAICLLIRPNGQQVPEHTPPVRSVVAPSSLKAEPVRADDSRTKLSELLSSEFYQS